MPCPSSPTPHTGFAVRGLTRPSRRRCSRTASNHASRIPQPSGASSAGTARTSSGWTRLFTAVGVKKRCSQVEDVLGVDAPVRLGTAALVARPRHVAELLRRRLVAVHWVGDALEAAALLALIPQGVALAHRASPTELEPASAYVLNTPT